jgi:hypothetical protein
MIVLADAALASSNGWNALGSGFFPFGHKVRFR